MFKLIIVNDETVTLKHLSTLYRWEEYGFTLAGTFSNGKAALDYINENPVNLVITEVKMPYKGGLELAKICYDLHPDIYFIFMSAYREFEYAQEATRYNVIDYITKPFNLSSFEYAIQRAHKKLTTSEKSSLVSTRTQTFQQQIFSHVLFGVTPNQLELSQEMKKIGLDTNILDNECAILFIRLKNLQKFLDNFWKYGLERLHNAIFFLLGTDESIFSSLIRFSFDTAEFICINKSGETSFDSRLKRYIKEFKSNLYSVMGLECEYINTTFFDSVNNINDQIFNSKPVIEKAKEYINEHYNENISLKDVASHVALSPIYFSAFFKQHANDTFSNYLKKIRLKKALGLLKDTNLSVASVCKAVGYKNMTYFYNMIKQETDMTPSDYREYIQKTK